MKKIVKILIAVILIFIGFNFVKNNFVQVVVSGALSKAANVPVRVGITKVQLISTTVDLKNIQVLNPGSFPEKLMLDAPQIYISFDLPALFKGSVHFREVKLNIKELVVIKNAKGDLNINALKPKESGEVEAKKSQKSAPKLKIDKLSLTIDRVVYKDYTQGTQPGIQVFDIKIQNRQYANVEDGQAVVSLIMFEALTRTSLSRLAGLELGVFKDGAGGLISTGLGFVKGEAGDLQNAAKGLLNLFK